MPIHEGHEEEHDPLQAPGQLSDADDEDPWIPDPHKPKAARSLNFDLHATTDVHTAAVEQPANSVFAPAHLATQQRGPHAAARGSLQAGTRKPSEMHLPHGVQAGRNLDRPAIEKHLQPQQEPQKGKARGPAMRSKTPARAQRQEKQAAQQMQGLDLQPTENLNMPQGSKMAKGIHASDRKAQHMHMEVHKTRTTARDPERTATQVLSSSTLPPVMH